MSFSRILHSSGSGAIDIEHGQSEAYRVAEIRLHLGAVVTDLDDLEVSIDSELGAGWDLLLAKPDSDSADLTTITDWRYADQVPPIIFPGDKLIIAWPNTGNVAWAIEVIGCA